MYSCHFGIGNNLRIKAATFVEKNTFETQIFALKIDFFKVHNFPKLPPII